MLLRKGFCFTSSPVPHLDREVGCRAACIWKLNLSSGGAGDKKKKRIALCLSSISNFPLLLQTVPHTPPPPTSPKRPATTLQNRSDTPKLCGDETISRCSHFNFTPPGKYCFEPLLFISGTSCPLYTATVGPCLSSPRAPLPPPPPPTPRDYGIHTEEASKLMSCSRKGPRCNHTQKNPPFNRRRHSMVTSLSEMHHPPPTPGDTF